MQNTQQAFSGAIPRGTMGNIASNYETIRESNDDNLRNLILDTQSGATISAKGTMRNARNRTTIGLTDESMLEQMRE